mmetsp:Transcript_32722/g.93988  ORF Transcript_32722/g.93988 Transcript_32722/m.93988 type:complete len:208 (-) Transcript_32722:90-713(-)
MRFGAPQCSRRAVGYIEVILCIPAMSPQGCTLFVFCCLVISALQILSLLGFIPLAARGSLFPNEQGHTYKLVWYMVWPVLANLIRLAGCHQAMQIAVHEMVGPAAKPQLPLPCAMALLSIGTLQWYLVMAMEWSDEPLCVLVTSVSSATDLLGAAGWLSFAKAQLGQADGGSSPADTAYSADASSSGCRCEGQREVSLARCLGAEQF